jgi:XTP/dITP diphosphohydrolase
VKLYFLTMNALKLSEAEHYAVWRETGTREGVELCCVRHDVQEILDSDITKIIRQKAVAAYAYMGYPCLVEHGGLFMDALPGLPGGVGKIVWDAVQDRMCDFLRAGDSREATARSYLGYCDGRRVRVYMGETRGHVAQGARGAYKFGWDPIFVPESDSQTYGEMGLEKKRDTSPVYRAWDAFFAGERTRFKQR